MKNRWIWAANKSLGDVELGVSIGALKCKNDIVLDEKVETEVSDWETYKVANEKIYIDFENESVVCIRSYEYFFFREKNIIGMHIQDLIMELGVVPDERGESIEYEDGDIQVSYDFLSLGLHVYCSDDVIVSATCLTYQES